MYLLSSPQCISSPLFFSPLLSSMYLSLLSSPQCISSPLLSSPLLSSPLLSVCLQWSHPTLFRLQLLKKSLTHSQQSRKHEYFHTHAHRLCSNAVHAFHNCVFVCLHVCVCFFTYVGGIEILRKNALIRSVISHTAVASGSTGECVIKEQCPTAECLV